MGRKSAWITRYKCLICQVEFIGLNSLKEHLAKYIDYSFSLPFPCGGCDSAFRTKDERNEHCKKERHTNEYKTNDDPSKEMLLEHLLFDAEQAKLVGVESLVKVKHEIFYSDLNTLQCNADKMLKCTLCAKKMDNQALRNHIKQHLKYKMYMCNCKRKFYSEQDVAQHTLVTGHQQEKQDITSHHYCEMIVNHLMMESKSNDTIDVINACKAAAMQKLRLSVLQLPTKRTRITHKERTCSNTASTSDLEPCSLLSDDIIYGTETRPSTSRIDVKEGRAKPVQNRISSSINKQKQPSATNNTALVSVSRSVPLISKEDPINLEVMDDRDEPTQPISVLSNGHQSVPFHSSDLRTLEAVTKCFIKNCGMRVSSHFLQRQKHVSEKHMPREHSDDDYIDLLEDAMKRAFPGRTFSSNQCDICGIGKCSDPSARREHVKKNHSDMLFAINCPVCNQTYGGDITLFKKHWKNDHKDGKDIDSGTKKLADRRKRLYGIKLTEITNVAYPEETSEGFRPVTLPDVEPIGKNLSESPARRTHVVGKHSARSRRKSESSDSDSVSEMEVINGRTTGEINTAVPAQINSQQEIEQIHGLTPSVTSDTSSSDDDENYTEIAPPAIHVSPLPALCTESTNHQRVFSSSHSFNAPPVRLCTKRIHNEVNQPRALVISSEDSSSDEDSDDDIMILKECSGRSISTTSSPVTSSLGSEMVTPSTSKKSRIASEGNTNIKDSQNKSRWDQIERSSNGQRKSYAKVCRYIDDNA